MGLEAPGVISFRFVYQNQWKSIGNKLGSSWSHFLWISLSELGLEAPGAISFRLLYSNKGETIGKGSGGPFTLDSFIKANRKSIGNGPGSSWSHFL